MKIVLKEPDIIRAISRFMVAQGFDQEIKSISFTKKRKGIGLIAQVDMETKEPAESADPVPADFVKEMEQKDNNPFARKPTVEVADSTPDPDHEVQPDESALVEEVTEVTEAPKPQQTTNLFG